MTETRRALLWGVFSLSLVMLYDGWQKHNGQPSLFSPQPAVTAAAPGAAAASGGTAVPAPGALPAGASTATAPATPAPVAAASEKVEITTDLVKATIDTRGASLVSMAMLKQRDDQDASKPMMLFQQSAEHTYEADSGLIPRQAGDAPLPNHQTVMTAVPGERTLADGKDELAVSFESPEVSGVQLRKTYVFKRGSYAVQVRHEVVNHSAAALNPQLYLQLVRDGHVPDSSMFMGPSAYTGPAIYTDAKKFQKVEFKAIHDGKADHEKSADNGWIAMVQHYYASAWIVGDKMPREFRTARTANDLYATSMVLAVPEIAAGASRTVEATLFAGPQEEKKLEALAPGLDLVKDYGMLAILAKPLFWLLEKLHSILGNWGWAIMALVVLLRIAFYGLNVSAYRSMAKMKAINPRIQELRERLKDKPQEMQQQMMKIYREEKINPLGGCLPIFVQMPFFISLYWVLLSTVEMRNAPWIGWITDLSVKDPLFILPVLMTGSTLLQTWLNPTPPDPVQAKMMWIMPLMFSVMFFFFPAGLVLYWFTNNVLAIAQQWFINKQLGVAK